MHEAISSNDDSESEQEDEDHAAPVTSSAMSSPVVSPTVVAPTAVSPTAGPSSIQGKVFTNSSHKEQHPNSRRPTTKKQTQNARDIQLIGKGSSELSNPSQYENHSRTAQPNRICTGLFVTRLDRKTTSNQLAKHIHRNT